MRTILLSTLIALGLAAMPAGAEHCLTYSTHEPNVDLGPTPAGHYYVDWEFAQPMCEPCEIWIFEETNGIEGLQRQDETIDNTCHGMISGDGIVV